MLLVLLPRAAVCVKLNHDAPALLQLNDALQAGGQGQEQGQGQGRERGGEAEERALLPRTQVFSDKATEVQTTLCVLPSIAAQRSGWLAASPLTWKVCSTGAYDQGLPSGMFHHCCTDWCIACTAEARQHHWEGEEV